MLGKVFWAGALAAIAGLDAPASRSACTPSSGKEFVRRERRSSVEARPSTRSGTCSSATSPTARSRARRARTSTGARRWIESLGRREDRAEMVAHHYSRRSSLRGDAGGTSTSSPRRGQRSREAGDRAVSARRLRRGRALLPRGGSIFSPEDEPERAGCSSSASDSPTSPPANEEQDRRSRQTHIRALLDVGDRSRAAEVDSGLLAEACMDERTTATASFPEHLRARRRSSSGTSRRRRPKARVA